MPDFRNSPEFQAAVDERVRQILRAELNDYLPIGAILPIQIRGERPDGTRAEAGDTIKYNAVDEVMEVGP